MADEIVKVPDTNDPEWSEIVDKLIDEMGEELPDKVIEATELLLSGYSTHQAARKIGSSPRTIRQWLEKYPTMAMAVRNGRQLLTKWRLSKLEQQFVLAADKSREILELSMRDSDVNAKLVGVVGQHARFILSMFMGQKIDIDIQVTETPQLKARNDALAYLAQQMASMGGKRENVIEASYTVVTPEKTTGQPLLDERGDPFFGKLGELDRNTDGVLCHICGQRSKHPIQHIVSHRIGIMDYCLVFMINKEDLNITK
jgi:hypothetical protein